MALPEQDKQAAQAPEADLDPRIIMWFETEKWEDYVELLAAAVDRARLANRP